MNKKELIEKLADIEWEDFEVKSAKSNIPANTWETVSAFSNTAGGWIVFGVKKEGKNFSIEGVDNPEKTEQDFTTTLRGEKFNKKILVTCKKYKIEKRTVLAFNIPLSESKPVYFNNPTNTFIRNASGDQRLTKSEIDSMFRDAAYGTKDKESTDLTIKDLNNESINSYINYLNNVNSTHSYNKLNKKELLEKLRVISNNKVTIAGALFFGRENSINKIISDFRIDYLEIPGTSYTDATNRYNYRLPQQENIFEYYFSIYPKLIKQIEIPFELTKKGLATDDQPQVQAIREALVNMLMHNDYFSNAKPRIRVFSDRIEFFNPGKLPKDVETLMKEDISLPRNPLIAKMFRVINLAESAGYGFEKMFDGWKSHYVNKPEVTQDIDFYKITFKLATLKDIEGVQKGGIKGGIKGGMEKSTLNDRQRQIVTLVKGNPNITLKEISVKLNINISAIQKHIDKLKNIGVLKRIGKARGGRWIIN